jgi:DNA-binding transcriptional regulator GbsR (MarR family)
MHQVSKEVVREYGEAYHAFGLNRVMGHVVGLLISSEEPLSLDEICSELGRSKGPISQIMRRLLERNLVRKVLSQENSRKDYYEIHPRAFENAFRNHAERIRNNIRIAKRLKAVLKESGVAMPMLSQRLSEMEEFFTLMDKFHEEFLNAWQAQKEQATSKHNGKSK